jgi:hypothetical protein
MADSDSLEDRIDALTGRVAAGDDAPGLVEEVEQVLCEGYLAALHADAARRRSADPDAGAHAAALRRRLAALRRDYIRLAGIRTTSA